MPSVSSWVSIGFGPCETSLNFAKIDPFMPKFVNFFPDLARSQRDLGGSRRDQARS